MICYLLLLLLLLFVFTAVYFCCLSVVVATAVVQASVAVDLQVANVQFLLRQLFDRFQLVAMTMAVSELRKVVNVATAAVSIFLLLLPIPNKRFN